MIKLTKIPINNGSKLSMIKFPAKTAAGPAMTEAKAYCDAIFRLVNKIIISGTKSTAPRKPIDIKLKSKMMSPKDPVVSKAAEKSTAIMVILTSCRFFFSSKLFFKVPLTTSRLMIVLMPNASPAPVPTTAISKVAMTMPPSHEGIYSMTNCGKAIFAETRSRQFSFMYIPMRMPPTPIGGIMNALISAPFLASLSLLPDKHACA